MQKAWVRALTTAMVVAVMVMIYCFSMEPAGKSDETSTAVTVWVADTVRSEWREYPESRKASFFEDLQFLVRKCAHFTEFAMLGFCLRLCLESWFGRKRFWLFLFSWLGGTLYAMTDEWHQLMIDGRSGQWTDVMIDSFGVLCGVLVITGAMSWVRLKLLESGKKKTSLTENTESVK